MQLTTDNKGRGNERMTKRHEIAEGVSGSGNTLWIVVTTDSETGRCLWMEYFRNKAEAQRWLEYAC